MAKKRRFRFKTGPRPSRNIGVGLDSAEPEEVFARIFRGADRKIDPSLRTGKTGGERDESQRKGKGSEGSSEK